MGAYVNFILLTLVGFVSSISLQLPVERCTLADEKCMKKAFQDAVPVFMAGIPELGIEVLDVMDLEDVGFDLAGLQFSLTEGKLKGLKNSVIDTVKWDTVKNRFDIKYHVNCSAKGHYTAGGRVLILPITGDGQIKLKMRNLVVQLHLDYEIKKLADGKEYAIPSKFGFTFDVKDGTHFDMTNLFNGNKELSDAMLRFLNDNWRDVTNEFGRPIMNAAAKKIFKNVVTYLSKIPIDELAIVKA